MSTWQSAWKEWDEPDKDTLQLIVVKVGEVLVDGIDNPVIDKLQAWSLANMASEVDVRGAHLVSLFVQV